MIIGIAGPYSAATEEQRAQNLDSLNDVAVQVYRKGHIPFIGVNAALPVALKFDGNERYSVLMDISMALTDQCDALLVMGSSPGADRECELVLAKGLPVYYALDEIPAIMQTPYTPEGYNTVMPYLIVQDAAAFMQFLAMVFGAEEKMKHMRSDDVIQHAEMRVGSSVIMLADTMPGYPPRGAGMFIYVPDADACFERAIAAGATVIEAVSDKPYGRTGGLNDPFGNTWWITTDKT